MMLEQTIDPMWAGRGDRQPPRHESLASPIRGSTVSCSSCGRTVEHGEALCAGCGRAVLVDVTLTSERRFRTRSRTVRLEAVGAPRLRYFQSDGRSIR
jgi:hypothetical protein